MKTQIQTITPEIATLFLQNHVGNRDYRKNWVSELSRMIKRGEWLVTHQGIALDKSGNLIDGQHRLKAIIESGIPVQINVSYDVDAITYTCIDRGVKRNLADITRFSTKTAEVVGFMSRFLQIGFGNNPTSAIAQEIYDNGVGEISDELNAYASKNMKFYSSAAFRVAAVVSVMDGRNKDYVFNTYSNLINMHMDRLPPIAHSLMKQVHNYNISTHDKPHTVARALKIFDPKRANSQLVLTANDVANVIPYVRNVYKNYVK